MPGYNFTERTRVTLVDARRRALALGHDSVECLHLLLAILHDLTPALEQAFATTPRSPQTLFQRLEARTLAAGAALPDLDLIYEEEAQTVLRLAMQVAERMGHDTVTPEHLLVVMAGQSQTSAARFLADEGVTESKIATALGWSKPGRVV